MMMKDEESHPAAAHASAYDPFQGVARYPPPGHPEPPSIGFPHLYYPYAYQSVPSPSLPSPLSTSLLFHSCCGIGCCWFLFIIGFFLIAIPWYVGLLILMCGRSVDYREKPGLIACAIAAILGISAIIIEATMNSEMVTCTLGLFRLGDP